MTLRERCEKFYEKNKLVGIIEKFKAAFYNYDWEKLDDKYIIKYQKDNDGKGDYVVLRTEFLREIANLANISSDFEIKLDFLNELVKQRMIDSYKHFVDSELDRVVISIDKYEEKETVKTKKLKITSSLIHRKNSMKHYKVEDPINIDYKTGYLSEVGSELYRKAIWNDFYGNDTVIIRPHIHNLMENPNDLPTKKSCDGVLLFVFSTPKNENIVTFPGWYDEINGVWKRSCNDAPIDKSLICGWADFQIYENVAESKMFKNITLDITCPRK